MLFDHTLQAAMGLPDGVKKWAIWRQHDHMGIYLGTLVEQ